MNSRTALRPRASVAGRGRGNRPSVVRTRRLFPWGSNGQPGRGRFCARGLLARRHCHRGWCQSRPSSVSGCPETKRRIGRRRCREAGSETVEDTRGFGTVERIDWVVTHVWNFGYCRQLTLVCPSLSTRKLSKLGRRNVTTS